MAIGPSSRRCTLPAVSLLLALAIAVGTQIARADEGALDEQSAVAEYQEGVRLAAAKNWTEAEVRFARVAEFRAAPPVLVALARAQVENGKLATAKATLERAVSFSESSYAQIVSEAKELLRALGPRVPRVQILLPAGVNGADVAVDGKRVDATRALELDPGSHAIVVNAPGHEPFTADVTMEDGERRDVKVVLSAADGATTPSVGSSPPEAAPGQAESESHRSIVGPLALGGAGAVAGVVGLVVRLGGQSDYDEAEKACRPCVDQTTADRGNDARSTMLTGTIVMGVGLAAIAGAGVWWALSGTSPPPQDGVHLGVTPLAGGAVGSVHGSL